MNPGPPIGDTPLVPVAVPLPGRTCTLWLKLEGTNEFGSIKARTAQALVERLENAGALRPGGTVVESTSGNLGVALAGICRRRGYRCVLVADQDTPELSRELMRQAGADLVLVPHSPDGNAVGLRLATVQRILATERGATWTDQYASPANPEVHRMWTAPELVKGLGGRPPHAVVAVVSTGGTLAGLSGFFREHHPGTTMVCVDAAGSAATGGTVRARPFKLSGFGSGRPSDFLRSGDWDVRVSLEDGHAVAACRVVRARLDLSLGGSSGAAVLGAVMAALSDERLSDIAVVCPDFGDRYENSVYGGGDVPQAETVPAVQTALRSLAASRRVQRPAP